MGVAQSVKLIQGRAHGETAELLSRDLPLTNDLGLGPRQLLVAQALGPQNFRLSPQLRFHEFDFLGSSSAIEGEVPRGLAREDAGPDIVGQAQFIADAHEQSRPHVAAGFLDEFQGEAIGRTQTGSVETQGQHRLLLFARFFRTGNRWNRHRYWQLRPRLVFPAGEMGFEQLSEFLRIHVSKDSQHAIARHRPAGVELAQVGGTEAADDRLVPQRIQSIALVAEQPPPHRLEGALQQLIALATDRRQLGLAFAFQCGLGEARLQEDFGEESQPLLQVFAHHLAAEAEGVVAAIGLDAAAEAFDFLGNVFGRAGGSALDEEPREHRGDAGVGWGFHAQAPLEDRPYFHEGQSVVFLHQHPQPVGERQLDDGMGDHRRCLELPGHPRFLGHKPEHGAVVVAQVGADNADEVVGGDGAHGRQVAFRKVQVLGGHPIASQVLSLSFHRLPGGQSAHGELLDRLGQFCG